MGRYGTSMTVEYPPGIEKRRIKRRKIEEARWARRSGPVRVRSLAVGFDTGHMPPEGDG